MNGKLVTKGYWERPVKNPFFMHQSWASHEHLFPYSVPLMPHHELLCQVESYWLQFCLIEECNMWFLLVWTVNKFQKRLSFLNYLWYYIISHFCETPLKLCEHQMCSSFLQKCVPNKEWLCGAASEVSPLDQGAKNYSAELQIPPLLMVSLSGLCISL